jgi:hypothetical protein
MLVRKHPLGCSRGSLYQADVLDRECPQTLGGILELLKRLACLETSPKEGVL